MGKSGRLYFKLARRPSIRLDSSGAFERKKGFVLTESTIVRRNNIYHGYFTIAYLSLDINLIGETIPPIISDVIFDGPVAWIAH